MGNGRENTNEQPTSNDLYVNIRMRILYMSIWMDGYWPTIVWLPWLPLNIYFLEMIIYFVALLNIINYSCTYIFHLH